MEEKLVLDRTKPLVPKSRVQAVVSGRNKAKELLVPESGLSNSVSHASHQEIEVIIEQLEFYDETSKFVAGMGVCLPSLLRYEKSKNKQSPDFLKTILFNHYLKQYLETIESPEPVNLLMNNLKEAVRGYKPVKDDEFLKTFQSVVRGQWHETAFRNILCAGNCIAGDSTVEEDRESIDFLVPNFDGSFCPIDVKSSLNSLPKTTEITFIDNKTVKRVPSVNSIPYNPGFAVALKDNYKDSLVLVVTGLGRVFCEVQGVTKDPESPSGLRPTGISCIRPVPRFGGQYGEIDFRMAVINLRHYFDSLPPSSIVQLDKDQMHERFSERAISQLFN